MAETPTTMPRVSHETPSALAHALRDYARPDFGANISLLPYNRFRPDDTSWWLCPGPQDPAYHYGKFIAKGAEPSGNLFAGVCFEKGIGASAAEAFKTSSIGKSWIVRDNWIWNAFFDALSDGGFEKYALAAQRAAGMPVNVIVSAAMMNPPDPRKSADDVYEMLVKLPRQRVYYTFNDSHLSLIPSSSDPERLIRAPSDCRTLADLAMKIKKIEKVDWIWVDVELGFVLKSNDGGNPEWHTETIWANACEPFLDWFH